MIQLEIVRGEHSDTELSKLQVNILHPHLRKLRPERR